MKVAGPATKGVFLCSNFVNPFSVAGFTFLFLSVATPLL